MSEDAGTEAVVTTPEEDADFARRLAAGTGGGDWHLTEADITANEAAKAVDAGDADADFAQRLAAGTGGGDWWRSPEDVAAAEAPGVTPYVDSGLSPEQQQVISDSHPTSDKPEPQSPSLPGPTPGAETEAAQAAEEDPA